DCSLIQDSSVLCLRTEANRLLVDVKSDIVNTVHRVLPSWCLSQSSTGLSRIIAPPSGGPHTYTFKQCFFEVVSWTKHSRSNGWASFLLFFRKCAYLIEATISLKRRYRRGCAFSSAGVARRTGHKVSFELSYPARPLKSHLGGLPRLPVRRSKIPLAVPAFTEQNYLA